MSLWLPIKSAARDAGKPVLLWIGETIPDLPDIRCGQWIHEDQAMELGEDLNSFGGWLIWNTGSDWFVIPFHEPMAWAELPMVSASVVAAK